VEKKEKKVKLEDDEEIPKVNEVKKIEDDEEKLNWRSLTSFGWDQNDKNVSVYVMELPGILQVKDNVKCTFGANSFDLRIKNYKNENHRLHRWNLSHEIIPNQSSFTVKKDKIVLTLKKPKGKYGISDHWTELLSDKKPLTDSVNKKKDDPLSGVMDLMKKMYDEGDDKTREMIGKAMLESRQKQMRGEV